MPLLGGQRPGVDILKIGPDEVFADLRGSLNRAEQTWFRLREPISLAGPPHSELT